MTDTHFQMPRSSSEALARFYAAEERYIASGRRDFDALATAVDPEILVVVPDSLPYGGRWRGPDGLRRFMEAFADAWVDLTIDDVDIVEAAKDRALVLLTMNARARQTGRAVTMPIVQVNRFRAGRLCEVRPYYADTVTVRQALGCG